MAPAPPPLPTAPPQACLLLSFTHGAELPHVSHPSKRVSQEPPPQPCKGPESRESEQTPVPGMEEVAYLCSMDD